MSFKLHRALIAALKLSVFFAILVLIGCEKEKEAIPTQIDKQYLETVYKNEGAEKTLEIAGGIVNEVLGNTLEPFQEALIQVEFVLNNVIAKHYVLEEEKDRFYMEIDTISFEVDVNEDKKVTQAEKNNWLTDQTSKVLELAAQHNGRPYIIDLIEVEDDVTLGIVNAIGVVRTLVLESRPPINDDCTFPNLLTWAEGAKEMQDAVTGCSLPKGYFLVVDVKDYTFRPDFEDTRPIRNEFYTDDYLPFEIRFSNKNFGNAEMHRRHIGITSYPPTGMIWTKGPGEKGWVPDVYANNTNGERFSTVVHRFKDYKPTRTRYDWWDLMVLYYKPYVPEELIGLS